MRVLGHRGGRKAIRMKDKDTSLFEGVGITVRIARLRPAFQTGQCSLLSSIGRNEPCKVPPREWPVEY